MSQEEEVITNLYNELKTEQSKTAEMRNALASSSFQGAGSNPIEYQLDKAELLNKMEHFLRGDFISIDAEGNECWKIQEDPEKVFFNTEGVSAIMSKVSGYIDKNVTLSFYSEDRINDIIADLGDHIADWILDTYEALGMNTKYKESAYQITVLNLLHTIESVYRRALHGKTLEQVNSSRLFTFNESNNGLNANTMAKKKFSLFKPKTW